MQAEVEKDQQAYEEIESLEDSHIVSFPKLDKEKGGFKKGRLKGKESHLRQRTLMDIPY